MNPSNVERGMPVLTTSDFRKGAKVEIDGKPYLMEECEFMKPGKGQAVYRTKLRCLLDDSLLDRTYRSGDSLQAADVRDGKCQFLYRDREKLVFMDMDNYEQHELPEERVGTVANYLLEGAMCEVMYWNDIAISVEIRNHVVLAVAETESAAKGNTATNVTKPAVVETGVTVQVPAFINVGDKIRIDTRTGDYIERVKG